MPSWQPLHLRGAGARPGSEELTWGCTCRLPVPGVPERAVLLLAWREFCRCSQPQPALVICRCSCPPSSALCVPGADPALQGAELTRAWRWEVTLGHGEGFWHPHQPRCPGEAVGGSAPEASPPGEQRGPIRAADQPPPTPTPPPAIPDSGGAVLTPSPLDFRVGPQRGASLPGSRTRSGAAGWGPVGAGLGLGLGSAASSLQTPTCWGWSPGRSQSSPGCRGGAPGRGEWCSPAQEPAGK